MLLKIFSTMLSILAKYLMTLLTESIIFSVIWRSPLLLAVFKPSLAANLVTSHVYFILFADFNNKLLLYMTAYSQDSFGGVASNR